LIPITIPIGSGRANPAVQCSATELQLLVSSRKRLQEWISARDFAGYDPYDVLNSPYLAKGIARTWPINILLIQIGRRFVGERLRRWLDVPVSKNPKTLGLLLSALCDLSQCGEDVRRVTMSLKGDLAQLRSPDREFCCWGYNFDFFSARGPAMLAFRPNAIATYFCAQGLLDMAETFYDVGAREMAESAARFFQQRLNRSVDEPDKLCFSYTPDNHSVIYNSSALVAAFLARLSRLSGGTETRDLSRRAMNFLVASQRPDGSWLYGNESRQRWIDHFHTGYNLCALLDYMEQCDDRSFEASLVKGYEFYIQHLFDATGAPKYFHNSLYPIDIHSCSQAILTLLAFADRDPSGQERAIRTALWTIRNMQAPEGFFYFQRHRCWTNRTAFMRWGQAWMLHALARLECAIRAVKQSPV